MNDARLNELREQINAVDRAIFASVNERLRLVAHLKQLKDELKIGFLDPKRETELYEARLRENDGPLSDDGLRRLYGELLALVKRELP